MPSLRDIDYQPSTRLQNVTATEAPRFRRYGNRHIFALQGDLLTLRSLISGTYHLWYIANDLLLYRTISLLHCQYNHCRGYCWTSVSFGITWKYHEHYYPDRRMRLDQHREPSATISQTGTFSIILGGSLLVVLIGKPMVLAWTCNAMAFTDMPYAIPLLIAGDPHITVDSQFSYEMTGQVPFADRCITRDDYDHNHLRRQ